MPVAQHYKQHPKYAGTQTDAEFVKDALRQALPWTEAELLRVRDKARALVRTNTSVDLPGRRTMTAFDGHAVWELMGALDRVDHRD